MVTIDRYGRVLILKEIRERLGLSPNMTLDLAVKGDGLCSASQRGFGKES
ncbi:MAG: AbrB/MazE/SpoVT family DNA-binding domain-containing protein [Candidatus Bathycorpusculaceae bacterium]